MSNVLFFFCYDAYTFTSVFYKTESNQSTYDLGDIEGFSFTGCQYRVFMNISSKFVYLSSWASFTKPKFTGTYGEKVAHYINYKMPFTLQSDKAWNISGLVYTQDSNYKIIKQTPCSAIVFQSKIKVGAWWEPDSTNPNVIYFQAFSLLFI